MAHESADGPPIPGLSPVFLDRDGVVNRNMAGYVRTVADWVPIPGSIDSVARLSTAGHPVVVVSNQSAIARGLTSREEVERINSLMRSAVERAGGRLLDVYYCPHHPDEGCGCRKPSTGMIDRARREHGLPESCGFMVGDAMSDMQLARRAGLIAIMVRTGRGSDQLGILRKARPGSGTGDVVDSAPDHVCKDLAGAVDLILELDAGGPGGSGTASRR